MSIIYFLQMILLPMIVENQPTTSIPTTHRPTPSSPIADFTGTPLSGSAPLQVQFTDQSIGDNITFFFWNFGDFSTSFSQNPIHTYALPGTYSVVHAVTNEGGSNTLLRSNYINVSNAPTTSQPTTSHPTLCTGSPCATTPLQHSLTTLCPGGSTIVISTVIPITFGIGDTVYVIKNSGTCPGFLTVISVNPFSFTVILPIFCTCSTTAFSWEWAPALPCCNTPTTHNPTTLQPTTSTPTISHNYGTCDDNIKCLLVVILTSLSIAIIIIIIWLIFYLCSRRKDKVKPVDYIL